MLDKWTNPIYNTKHRICQSNGTVHLCAMGVSSYGCTVFDRTTIGPGITFAPPAPQVDSALDRSAFLN